MYGFLYPGRVEKLPGVSRAVYSISFEAIMELELAPLLLVAQEKVVDELRKPDHPKSLQK